jgi:DNA polymerase elongation subunit (family B)
LGKIDASVSAKGGAQHTYYIMENILDFYTNVSTRGNSILYRGIENGERVSYRTSFQPELFVPTTNTTDWKTITDRPVGRIVLDDINSAKEFVRANKNVSGRSVFGMTNWISQYIAQRFPKALTPDLSRVRVAYIDIEVQSDEGFPTVEDAKFPITAICVKFSDSPHYYEWAYKDAYTGPHDPELAHLKDHITYIHCDNELDMLMKFLNFWSNPQITPDVITGWNVKLFDVPYLIRRLMNIHPKSDRKLSPWELIIEMTDRDPMTGNEHIAYKISGIDIIDYMDLFKKFAFAYGTLESYSLDFVAHTVLGKKKLSYEEQGNLHQLYHNDFQKFIDYNIRDVELVHLIDQETKIMDLLMTIAYRAGCNYSDALGSVVMWDTYVYRELRDRKIVVPPKLEGEKGTIVGAYVKEPQIGRHDWVVSFDLSSLYPSLMRQFNMSPETTHFEMAEGFTVDACLNGRRPKTDPAYAVAANGSMFVKSKKGIFPEIIETLYQERKHIKKTMLTKQQSKENGEDISDAELTILNAQQMSIKIMLNSLYGCMANRWFRYYDRNVAEAITSSGQLAIRWAEKVVNVLLNEKLNTKGVDYVIAIDTDSIYLNLEPVVEMMGVPEDKIEECLDEYCNNVIQPEIQKGYDALAKYMNAYKNTMIMEREVIARRAVWMAKKRYIMDVLNSEGVHYPNGKLKIMGVEAVKSSTPAVCRTAFKELFKVILRSEEKSVQKALKMFRTHFESLSAEDIAFPRGVSKVTEYQDSKTIYRKGTPIHSRAALLYNHAIHEYDLDSKYDTIKNGEKIKFVYLKTPNKLRENVIAFPQYLPEEFDIHKDIDYDIQYEKAFMSGIRPILDAVGWKEEETVTLEDFFG